MKNLLSYPEMEELAESLIRKFYEGKRDLPDSVDISGFTNDFLKLSTEYHTFAEDDIGKVGFISNGREPLWVVLNGVRQNVVFPHETIVIEKYLREPREVNRLRFTIAHEDAHYLLDRTLSASSFCREYERDRSYNPQEVRLLFSIHERMVDRLAACLLMPRFMVKNVVEKYTGRKPIAIYGTNLLCLEDKVLVQKMADAMQVSYTAFLLRLKELGFYEKRDPNEFLDRVLGIGSGVPPQ